MSERYQAILAASWLNLWLLDCDLEAFDKALMPFIQIEHDIDARTLHFEAFMKLNGLWMDSSEWAASTDAPRIALYDSEVIQLAKSLGWVE